jgi:hypothetical protein
MRAGKVVVIAALSCASLPAPAQVQQRGSRTGWPCGGKVDSSFVRTAEATGGRVLLFAPTELAGFTEEMNASRGHDETVLRVAGQLTESQRDFDVPIDSSIESIYFFVSVQCLQSVAIIPPPGGAFNATAPGVEYHELAAIRLITIKAPSPGRWRIGVAGSGVYSLIVKANTSITLNEVSLSRDGIPIVVPTPLGERVHVETALSGAPADVSFHFVAMDGKPLQSFVPSGARTTDAWTTYVADVRLPSSEFRLLVEGVDAKGLAFQRVSPRLFVGDR